MNNMNFSSEITNVLSSLNWATADEDYTPILPSSEVSEQSVKSERQKSRLNKRKAMTEHLYSTRQELFDGEFDGCECFLSNESFSDFRAVLGLYLQRNMTRIPSLKNTLDT
jgi:hypothetical protein